MKVNACIKCCTWWVGFIQLTDEQKNAVITLQSAKVIMVETIIEICDCCRQEIGNQTADKLLRTFSND